MENIESITLSYTFFEAKEGAALVKPAYVKWKFPFVSSIGVIV
jgi:cytochrome c oxidase assembly protein Cox11